MSDVTYSSSAKTGLERLRLCQMCYELGVSEKTRSKLTQSATFFETESIGDKSVYMWVSEWWNEY